MVSEDEQVNTVGDGIASRVPFFYGWVMMPVVLLTLVATMPGQPFGISVFSPYLRASLGLSVVRLSPAEVALAAASGQSAEDPASIYTPKEIALRSNANPFPAD